MAVPKSTWWILAPWVLLVGGYAAGSWLIPEGPGRTAFGDILQCVVPLFANAGLLLNAATPQWRKNGFWMLLAVGCTLWLVGQLLWTYFELYLHQPVPNPFIGDAVFFLHTVPMIGALALQPHSRQADAALRFGYLDFLLLLSWWVYLYLFKVIPWQYIHPDVGLYGHSYNEVSIVENLVLVIGLGVLCVRSREEWRKIYGHLFGAASLYALGSLWINVAIDLKKYKTGSFYDIPLVASFVWFGTAGIVAWRGGAGLSYGEAAGTAGKGEGTWPARLAMTAVLSLPAIAVWNQLASPAPEAVREFRLIVTLAAMVVLTAFVFLRQHLLDRERLRLLGASQESYENLKRLQTQFVQSEKLASLGQLAAGAAHEINNPLTAILGYSDLLVDDATLGEKQRGMLAKLREQARRTKTLVTNLLSFARQVPTEKALLDINGVVASAVQLRALDLRDKSIRMDVQTESVVPGVRGDPNQLLQVFFNIISNAVDAMQEAGGGVLMVRTLREKASVVVEFSDTGPGIREPALVFDPFYTTKPVGKGTGLGLSICYGIVQEHGGRISCFNRPQGGATFRIELPGVLALFPETPGEATPGRGAAVRPATKPSS